MSSYGIFLVRTLNKKYLCLGTNSPFKLNRIILLTLNCATYVPPFLLYLQAYSQIFSAFLVLLNISQLDLWGKQKSSALWYLPISEV